MNILVVQNDKGIQTYLRKGLKESGYTVEICNDIEEAYYLAITDNYDLIITDTVVNEKSGITFCAKVRENNKRTGIIFLSSEGKIEKKIEALDAGADDYMVKPFSFIELLGRIRAILRRCQVVLTMESTLRVKDLTMNLLTREVKRGENLIDLTYREFALLEYLVRNKNLVLSRTMIREKIWSMNYTANTNIIDVYMTYLRNKLDKGDNEKLIYTVRGVGYILRG